MHELHAVFSPDSRLHEYIYRKLASSEYTANLMYISYIQLISQPGRQVCYSMWERSGFLSVSGELVRMHQISQEK